jgi:hypothetical protein
MKRVLYVATMIVIMFVVPAVARKPAREQSVAFQRYESYFVRNDWGLTGEPAYLAITSQAQFDQIFGMAAMGGSTFLPENAFDAKLVVATVVRGSFYRRYEVTKVTGKGRKLYVWYKINDEPSSSATFASPLILAVDKNDYEQVIFMKDGKQAGQVSVSAVGVQKEESLFRGTNLSPLGF